MTRQLHDLAKQVLRAVERGAGCALTRELREVDLVVLLGRRAEMIGGASGGAGSIVQCRGRNDSAAFMALAMQSLAGVIDGDRKMLAHIVERLTVQVELDAAAARIVDEAIGGKPS